MISKDRLLERSVADAGQLADARAPFVHLKTEDVVRHQLVGQIVAAYDRHSAIAGDHRDIERKGRRNHTDFDARQQADSTNQSETDDER